MLNSSFQLCFEYIPANEHQKTIFLPLRKITQGTEFTVFSVKKKKPYNP